MEKCEKKKYFDQIVIFLGAFDMFDIQSE